MKPDKEQFRYASPSFTGGGGLGSQAGQLAKVVVVIGLELSAWVLHYAAYSQTMTVMPGGFLVDIPGIGFLFNGAQDMTVNHLISGFLAVASVATPVFGFFILIRHRVIAEPEVYFAYPPHRIYMALLLAFWVLMLTVEVVNVLTLIQQFVSNPFVKSGAADALRDHEGLAYLSAAVIAITNAAVALGTALVWTSIFPRKEM